jgi:hypothetical protein
VFWYANLFTPSTAERDSYVSNPRGYVSQGVAFTVNTANPTNNTPLYRFTSVALGTAFYITSASVRDLLIANSSQYWRYDGPVFDVSASATGATPVYRFYLASGTHFYTVSETEKTTMQSNPANTYEGVGFCIAND